MPTRPYLQVEVTPDSARHWHDLAKGVLTVAWCEAGDHHVWFPKSLCPYHLAGTTWKALSGEGEVYTFSIVYRGGEPSFGEAPYVYAYISFDGGPTIIGNVVGDDALDVRIGDRVALVAPEEEVEVGAVRVVRV